MQTLDDALIATRPLAADRLSDRLAADLRSRIDGGALQPGQRLPTELALAGQYAVSRTVVREAVSRLRSAGLRVARQGSGVFVAAQDAARPLDAFHRTIADAAGNVQFPRLLRPLAQYLREAMAVTRRNASLKAEYMTEVRQAHRAMVAEHMRCAARRLQDTDAPIHQHPPVKTP